MSANPDSNSHKGSLAPQPQPRRRKKWPFVLIGFLLIGCAVLGAAGYYVEHQLASTINHTSKAFVIKQGESFRQIIKNLSDKDIIDNEYVLYGWGRFIDVDKKIRAGEYRFSRRTTQIELLDQIFKGDVITHDIRFLEGWTFKQFKQTLAKNKRVKQTIANSSDREILKAVGANEDYPEGLFFPSTYRYIGGQSDIDILKRAYGRMKLELANAWDARDKALLLNTPYEALTMASIIEKETGQAHEYRIISGVFANRLKKKMRLQTDPTVIYGLGDSFDGDLKRSHLRKDNPYNTYTRAGLPPTPIAMPGSAALKAAVNPGKTSAYYFVARGDGTHQFSNNLKQHNAAVRKFQLGQGKKKKKP
ncbi:MAG: endolytic transglycosylase MltG [Arenicellales bacterium WSBS_2016_MAG_OTU3]